jgi:hypothetical protein
MLERAAIGEIGGDPGRAKGVIADRRRNAGGDSMSRDFWSGRLNPSFFSVSTQAPT